MTEPSGSVFLSYIFALSKTFRIIAVFKSFKQGWR